MSEPPLRVLLVDDHEVVRDGVKVLLQATDDIIVSELRSRLCVTFEPTLSVHSIGISTT